MKKRVLISLLMWCCLTHASAQYIPDILGEGFETLTIEQPTTYDGEVVTTIVRHTPLESVTRAVLYVHGYNDYFFQRELAENIIEMGWQFYAVDLRRYGRSQRAWQRAFAVVDIEEYFEDIDAAIDIMQEEGIEEIVLMAHSTGGLTTPLYCHHNRENLRVDGLILNSPFFDMNLGGGFVESVGSPVISFLGALFKNWEVQGGSEAVGGYARSIHSDYDGEWSFDPSLKRLNSLPITAGWFRAIHTAQNKLQKGLDIPCPILVLYSDKSVWGEYNEEYMTSDSVLDVADIAQYAPCLGLNVLQKEIQGGMHDLSLSAEDTRAEFYSAVCEFLALL